MPLLNVIYKLSSLTVVSLFMRMLTPGGSVKQHYMRTETTTKERMFMFNRANNSSFIARPLWQAILLFIMQSRYLICYIRYIGYKISNILY